MNVLFPGQIGFRLSAGRGLQDYTAAERDLIAARLWPKVNKTESCWLWTGSLDRDGYGQLGFRSAGKTTLLKGHRLSWEFSYGPIPKTLQINHRCDVRHCLRPEHLYLGTQRQNLDDARKRSGLDERRPRTRKLTPDERLAIYHMPNRRGIVVELALHYHVSKVCITLTRQGRFKGSPLRDVFERVPFVNLPVCGEVW